MKAQRRHELHHDELGDFLGRVWRWIQRHALTLVFGVLVVAVLFGAATWLYSQSVARTRQANLRLYEAEQSAERFAMSRGAKTKEKADLDEAVRLCKGVARDYPGTPIAARALLRAGTLQFEEGKVDPAVQSFRKALAVAQGLPMMRRMARGQLGTALEQEGRTAEALKEYQTLARDPSRLAQAKAHWDVGRCREELREYSQAREAYALAMAAAPDSIWAELSAYRSRALTEAKPAAAEKKKAKKDTAVVSPRGSSKTATKPAPEVEPSKRAAPAPAPAAAKEKKANKTATKPAPEAERPKEAAPAPAPAAAAGPLKPEVKK